MLHGTVMCMVYSIVMKNMSQVDNGCFYQKMRCSWDEECLRLMVNQCLMMEDCPET